MDNVGKFIASCRKEKGLTQAQLAEKLGITDRAVSKWERGKSLPDASIMLELCQILEINVNELLSGKKINQESYEEHYKELAEERLLLFKKREEETNKAFLWIEIVLGAVGTSAFLVMDFVATVAITDIFWQSILIGSGLIIILVSVYYALKIERDAGYYECKHCHHRYVPTYSAIFKAKHIGRTRYMECPKCHQKSWQKKVLSKD